MRDNISELYKALQDTYELGSEDDFRDYLNDGDNREALRKELEAEWEVGDSTSFARYLGIEDNANLNKHNANVDVEANADDNGNTDVDEKPDAKPWEAKVAGVPSLYDIADKQREETPKMPNYRHEVSVDEEGGKISKPVVKWQPDKAERASVEKQMTEMRQNIEQSKEDIDTKNKYIGGLTEKPFDTGMQRIEIGNTESVLQQRNPRVVETSAYNTESGEFEKGYINEAGEYNNKAMAERDQKQIDRSRYIDMHPDYAGRANRNQVANMDRYIDDNLREAQKESAEIIADYIDNASLGALALMEVPKNPMMGGVDTDGFKLDNIPTEKAQAAAQKIREFEAASRSMRDAKRIIAEADRAVKEDKYDGWLKRHTLDFAGGVARGFGDKFFDIDTWDFGLTDIKDNSSLMLALDKADKGEELTESQRALLDAKAIELATQAYFGSHVGKGYNAGAVTAESIPFMLEMCINPAASAGTTAASKMARYALKRFAKKAVTEGVEELTERGLMRAAINAGKKNLVKRAALGGRITGDLVAGAGVTATTGSGRVLADTMDRMAGEVKYDENELGLASYAGRENQKEFGEAFAKAFASGTIENYSEMVGEYFSPILGVAGKYIGKGLDKMKLGFINDAIENISASKLAKAVNDFESHAKYSGSIGEFSEEIAGGILNSIFVGDQTLDTNEQTGVFNPDNLIDTYLGVSIFGGVMSGVKTFGYRTPKYRAKQNMVEQDKIGSAMFGNQDKWGQIRNTIAVGSEEDIAAVLQEVKNDDSLTQEQKMQAFKYAAYAMNYKGVLMAEQKRREEQPREHTDFETSFDNGYSLEGQEMNDAMNMYDMQREKAVQVLGEDKVAELDANPMDMAGIDTEEQLQVAFDYVNAKATFDGMGQKVLDDINTQIAESEKNLNELTSKTDGKIHPVTLKGERKAHIVDGNVAVTDNGEIDAANSDLSILVRDDETGKIEFVSPSDIVTSDGAIDAEEEKANVAQAIRDVVTQQADAQMNGLLSFNVGDEYNVLDDEGNAHTIAVVDNGQEGQVLVSVDGENVARMMPRDEVQKMANNANLARLAEHEAKKETKKQMENGETSGEADNNNVGAHDPLAATPDAMPMIKNSEDPDFMATTPERGHRYLYDEAGIPKAAADNMVTAHINAAEKEVKKQSDALAKLDANPGTSISAYKAKQADIKGKLDAAQAAYDYWNGVKTEQGKRDEAERQAAFAAQTADASGRQNELAAQKTPKEKIDAAKQMYGEYFDSDFTVPYDAMELVAMNMPNEKISWEGREGVRGLQQELGSNFKRGVGRDRGTNAFNIYLAKKGEGISTDEAIHSIYESAENTLPNGEHRWDVEEIRGAFIDMFMGAEKPGDIRDYVLNNRIRQAEQMRAAEDEAAEMARLDDEIMQRTGMEREEYAAWIAELEARADAQAAYENEVYNETNTSNDRETEGSIGEEGSGQVQGQEGDTTGVEEDGAEPVGDGGRNEGTQGDTTERQEGDLAQAEKGDVKKSLQKKVLSWLSEDNVDWAEGKDLGEIEKRFGNKPEPIAIMPAIVRENIESLGDDYLYCGKAYMIDHHANHHPELDVDEYVNIQSILDEYDDIKDLSEGDKTKVAFVKKLDKGYAVVVELSKENDKIMLHKTFFYKDSAGKRTPFKNKPSIKEKWSVDGSTTISPIENQQPADTENISALDQSSASKGTENSETDKENERKFNKGERYLLASGAVITIEDVDDKGERTFTWKSINNDNVHTSKATIEELEVMGARPLESVQKEEGQNESTINGAVDMATMQPVMGEEAFAELLESGDREMMEAYLKEIEHALRLGDNAPLDGQKEVRQDYKKAVEQYGKENIPAEVLAELTKRMEPYDNLARVLYDRKYALEDKLRNVDATEQKASAEKKDKEKAAHKQTAYNGFLADKTALGADAAEKALSKRINIEGEVMTVAEFVEKQHQSGSLVPSISEEPKYKGVSKRAWNRMDAAQQAAEEERVKNGGTKSVYRLNGYDLGKTAYDYAQYLMKNNNDNVDKVETEKPQKSEKKSSARASSVVKIDDFGEKIGGARKDLARGRIRDIKGYTTKDLTTLKKGADDILSQANILRLYKDGQMDEQTARGFLAMNNAVKVAIKKYGRTAKEIILNKYRDAAVAWEEGRAAEFGITEADVAAYMAGFDITEEKARKDLDYCITETFDMYMLTYQAMNYPAVERKLGQYVIVDYGSMRSGRIPLSRPFWVKTSYTSGRGYPFATLEGAMEKLNQLCPEVKPKDTEKKEKGEKAEHGLRVTKEGFGFYVKSRNIPGNIYLSPKFTSEKQAQAYMEENLEQLKAREQRLVDALMGSNIGMAEREGVDYRNGKDVTPQDFLDEFGFRGVEFGNWVPQGERQMYLNKTYDAIKDFCAIVGISPKAFSLGGRLGLAFGARGSGRALAHYEPGKEAINLTRMSGVGSLAHEWFHALDNILAKQETGNTSDMATMRNDVVREEVSAVLKEMYRVMKAMDYDMRSRRAGEYWGRTEEEFARLFENYIYNKLAEKEVTSPILVRKDILFDDAEEVSKNRWPYPSVAENATMAPLFDKLFSTIQEKTDEKGNVVLFQKLDGSTLSKEADATEMMMRDALIETMEGAGIEVVTDVAIGQQVLDDANGEARLMGGEMSERRKEREEVNNYIDEATSFVTGKDIKDVRRERIAREEQRRELTKEIYGIILSGDFNSVNLQKISDYINDVTPNNPYGRRLSKRLPQRVERALYDRAKENAIDALYGRAAESAVSPHERVSAQGRRAIEERKKKALEQWAKATGNWHTDLSDFTDSPTPISDDTTDSDVYMAKDGKYVIKLSRGKQGKRFAPDIDNIPLFNYVFPNSAYKILGYGDFGKGFVRILQQAAIDFETSEPLTEQERVAFMEGLGFKSINKNNTAFSNGEIIVADLQKNNIVKDAAGNISVIDADCKLHTKDVGGQYTYLPVEHDMPLRGGVREMRVYHGSGADFDAFDHSHMGEGEGAQAYGWGTYVTEVEGIGKTYAQSVGQNPIGRRPVLYKGESYDAVNTDGWSDEKKGVYVDLVQGMRVMGKSAEQAKDDLRLMTEVNIRNRERSLANLKVSSKNYQSIAEDKRKQEERLKHINEFNADDFTREGSTPTLYTVEIPEENAAYYIGYNERMREQQEIVEMADNELAAQGWRRQEIGERVVFTNSEGKRIVFTPNQTGADFYEEFVVALGSKKAASEFLSSVGITGTKYPAEFRSGGRTDGASNYVIFDESDIEITNKARLFRTSNGEVYGYTMDGKIYLDTRIATTETPIHEYSHLWSEALEQANPKAWEQLKNDLVKDTELMDYVKGLYPEIKDENELMHEVFAHFSGKQGRARLEEMRKEETEKANGLLDKARIIAMFNRLKELLGRYWTMARDLFAGSVKGLDKMKAEDFADMAMADLLGGFNPSAAAKNNDIRYQFVGEKSTTQEITEHINEIPKKYNLKGASIHQVISSREEMEGLRGILSDEAYTILEREYNTPNVKGVYLPEFALAIVFGEKAEGTKQGELTYIHEQVHAFYHSLPNDMRDRYGVACFDWLWRKAPEVYQKILRLYPASEQVRLNEACSFFIQELVNRLGIENFLNGTPLGDDFLCNFITEFKKYIRNEQKDREDLRVGRGVQDAETSRNGERLYNDNLVGRHYGSEGGRDRERGIAEGGKLYRQPAFYSNAERAVEIIKQEKATPEQWLAMIQKAGGLKAGEDKWMGLSDWLRQQGQPTTDNGQPKAKTLTKQEVLDFIRSNQIQIEEVNYAEESKGDETAEKEFFVFTNDTTAEAIVLSGKKGVSLSEASRELLDERYGEGWEDYVYIDSMGFVRKGEFVTAEEAARFFGIEYDKAAERAINSTRIDYTTEGLENKKEIALVVPTIEPWDEGDEIHFGDAGEGRAIAWIRFGDTTDADGKRVLVIDEIQSNRHQEGREKGYKGNKTYFDNLVNARSVAIIAEIAEDNYINTLRKKYGTAAFLPLATEEERSHYETLVKSRKEAQQRELESEQKYNINGVPDAPFDKNWHELAMKRMLRYAAENGYDKIAWTKGAQQAERYGIGNVADKIISYDYPSVADKEGRSTKKIEVRLKDGETMTMRVNDEGMVIEGRGDTYGKRLSEIVGKDLAARIMSGEGSEGIIYDADRDLPAKIIEGDGLRIGGEGMIGFYDQMLPRFMDKYGKKWGVKTTEVELPEVEEAGETMWAVDVTPEMRESVMEGQPMFREGGVLPTYEESLASSKAAGYTKKQHDAWWNRAHKNMRLRANDIAKKLHLDGVADIYETADDLNGVKGITKEDKKSKGWYDPKTGRIAIILGNHASAYDVMMTMLHEGVAHFGLRQLFGKNFETFLWNVYSNATPEVRSEINKLMAKNGWNYETATEEYLAGLAEDTDFERVMKSGWWWKIKDWFVKMLRDIGLGSYVPEGKISDNELRYVLWRSYYNLELGGAYGTLLGAAIDVAKQYELGVGKFAPKEEVLGVAESGIGMSLEETNRRFNDELRRFDEGQMKSHEVFHLGGTSPILSACGINTGEFRMTQSVLSSHMKKHSLTIDDLFNLPEALKTPIMVYDWGTRAKSHVIITNLSTKDGRKITVAIRVNDEGVASEITDIASVHGKDAVRLISEINNGQTDFGKDNLKWVDKEKALEWLSMASPMEASPTNQELSSAAKVVENFVNPKISAENVEKNAEKLHRSGDGTQEAYNNAVNTGSAWGMKNSLGLSGYNFREAFQDSMLALRKLQEVVEERYGIKLGEDENAYDDENSLSSRNQEEKKSVNKKVIEPMNAIVDNMISEEGVDKDELNDYLICKHGLERNVVMAERDARKKYDELVKAGQPADLNSLIKKYRNRDYSGLTGVTGLKSTRSAELAAMKLVYNFENSHSASCVKLWEAINKATKWTLKKGFDSGIMSKETYDKVRNMFQYYVPLRGWDEETAEDVYDYLMNDRSVFNGTVVAAKGHRHKSDDPLAIIANMADSAILQGNRNQMKQKLLNMAVKYPTDVCSVGDMWIVKSGKKWAADFPVIPVDASSEDVAQIVAQHDADMRALGDNAKRVTGKLDIEWHINKKNIPEHAVVVNVGGVQHVVYINGNPRAAQALNGLTGERRRDAKDKAGRLVDFVLKDMKRWYSSMLTQYNINFSGANYVRDFGHSILMTFINNGLKDTRMMLKYILPAIGYGVKARAGRVGNGEYDKYYKEFLENGGVTGYAHLDSVDKWKHLNDMRWERLSKLQKAGVAPAKVFQAGMEAIGWFSETLEIITRFNTYIKERKKGESIANSVKAAKNITVNFNKKGSEVTPGVFGAIANTLRLYKMFFNPIVQGLNQIYEAVANNPKAMKRLIEVCGFYAILGAVMPFVNMALVDNYGDDDDDYFLLNEYTRRTNWVIFTGKGYVKIPLPQFFREFYGMGEAIATYWIGEASDKDLRRSMVRQIENIFSIDGQEGYKEWSMTRFMLPGHLDPVADVENNENFMGTAIWNESIFKQGIPEYQKAKERTWKPLVGLAKEVNELQGGTENVAGEGSNRWNANPAAWQHLLENYGGGLVQFIGDAINVTTSALDGEMPETSNMPFAKRFYTIPTEESANWARYRMYKDFRKDYDRAEAEHTALNKENTSIAEHVKKIVAFEEKQPEAASIYYAWKDLDIAKRLKDAEWNSDEYWGIIREAVDAGKKVYYKDDKASFVDGNEVQDFGKMLEEDARALLSQKYSDGESRKLIESMIAKKHGAKYDEYSSAEYMETEYGKRYYMLRTFDDLEGDNILAEEIRNAKEDSDDVRRKDALDNARKDINKLKKRLGDPDEDDEKTMRDIRERRRDALKEFGKKSKE